MSINRITAVVCFLLTFAYAPVTPGQTVDGHIHGGFAYDEQQQVLADFSYFEERHIQAFSFPLPVKRTETANLVSMLSSEVHDLETLADTSNTYRIMPHDDGHIDQRMAVFLGIEYFHGIFGGSADAVNHYRDLGVRSITLVNNQHDELFEGKKLSKLGRQIIERMNASGILIDIAHLDEDEAMEVINHSREPVMASHSAAWSVANRGGNLIESSRVHGR